MKTIPLSQGKVAFVDDEDFEFLSQWKWFAMWVKGNRWYAARNERSPTGKQRILLMHRLLCSGREIDHRDGNGLNNQRKNLRSASRSLNIFNSNVVGKSGVRGIYWCKERRRWQAQITFNGKRYNLGRFIDKKDAREARRKGELKFFGEVYQPKAA